MSCIQDLYSTFEKYKPKNIQSYSPYKDSNLIENEIFKLKRAELKKLTGDDLAFCVSSMGYTWATLDDYKHYLPRILELVYLSQEDSIELFVVFEKFVYFDWNSWSLNEVDTLKKFFIESFVKVLSSRKINSQRFFEIFEGLLKVFEDIEILFESWFQCESVISLIYFCIFYEELYKKDLKKIFKIEGKNLESIYLSWVENKMHLKVVENFDELIEFEWKNNLDKNRDDFYSITFTLMSFGY